MTLTKIVNGEPVEMSAEEEASIRAEWASSAGPQVPRQVTRKQARKTLALAGLLSQVQPAIDAVADPQTRMLAQIDWDDSATFERDNPTLLMLAETLGLSNSQVDALFIQAAQL